MRRGLFGRLGKLGLNHMIQPNVSPPPVYLTQWKIVGNSEVKTLPYPDGVVLPTGYKRCEYIQGDEAYIELPFGFDETDEFYAKVKFNAKYTSERHIISTKQWNTDNNRFCFGVEASSFAVALGNITTANGKFTPNAPSNSSVCEVSYSNKQYTLLNNGDTFVCDLSNANFGSETAHICLLKNYNNLGTKGAIYEYRHKKGNTEYRFIPCLDDNNIPCIYDVINNQAYYNSAGSGSFTYKLYPQPTEIWSCGEYSDVDNKYHIVVLPQGKSPVDIALTEPLRMTDDGVADTIEFPSETEGKALVTRNLKAFSLANRSWNTSSAPRYVFYIVGRELDFPNAAREQGVILCNTYTVTTFADTYNTDKTIGVVWNGSYNLISIMDTNVVTPATDITGEAIFKLTTPTTELVDAPQIEEAESYSCVITPGGKAVSWSSFNGGILEFI